MVEVGEVPLISQSLKTQMAEFEKDLLEKPTPSGRGAKQLVSNHDAVSGVFAKVLNQKASIWISKMSASEQRYIKAPWMWMNLASATFAGPEFGQCASAKLQTFGERSVRSLAIRML